MTVDLVVALIYKPLAPVRGGFLLGGDNNRAVSRSPDGGKCGVA
jgi:hypothetical protein